MKIAISTIIDYNNYGNRLQNYALQEVLENLGHEVVTIRNLTDIQKPILEKTFENLKNGKLLKKISNKFIKQKQKQNSYQYDMTRNQNFRNFTKEYIHETVFSIDQNTTDFMFDEEFDCYVIGSDQVWNYNFTRFSSLDFVTFSNKIKISYAASFGVENIPENYKSVYKNGLNSIDFLSVREASGVQIVNELTGINAELVLDPTLLLSRSSWEDLIKNRKEYDEKFVLTYFLDEVTNENNEYINKFAKENSLEIKKLGSRKDLELWISDPIEFVNLFSQAEAIFTDSFHACVFSIIFEKYFEVFKRNNDGPSMSTRIDSLLQEMNLSNQWHTSQSSLQIIPLNYNPTLEIINVRRKESMEFLENALGNIADSL